MASTKATMHEGIVKEYFIIEVFEWLSEEEEVNFNPQTNIMLLSGTKYHSEF
jgi:hypothetical protein